MNVKSNLFGFLKRNSFPSVNSKTCQWCTHEYKRGTFHKASKDEEASDEIGCSVLDHQIKKDSEEGMYYFPD